MDAFVRRGYPLVLQLPGVRHVARSRGASQFFKPIAVWNQCHFRTTTRRQAVQPFLLADIGEGITECQIVSWAVKPGDKIEEFDPICEVQSDKASVEITSRFDGTIKSLLYEEGEVAVVGQPLLVMEVHEDDERDTSLAESMLEHRQLESHTEQAEVALPTSHNSGEDTLAEENVDIKPRVKDVPIKEEDAQTKISAETRANTSPSSGRVESPGRRTVSLTPTEHAMFGAMTESLKIPHFLYTHTIDFTNVNKLRREFNAAAGTAEGSSSFKLTPLPFIMKAVSQALEQFPKLNSHLDTTTTTSKPSLTMISEHNFGLAVDTPKGLLVPVVRGVENHTIQSLGAEIKRLNELAQAGRLTPDDFRNPTFIISNIGSIGGDAVAPIILAPTVGIVGLGRIREVPVFRKGEQGRDEIVKQEQMTLSWSADHRIIDGATVARAAKLVEGLLQGFERMS